MIEYAFKSIQRKPLRSILICAVLVLFFITELTGVYLYAVAAQGEDDAFRYIGIQSGYP